jgi:hypothetical protein
LIISWVAMLLDALILFRGLRCKQISRYPFFYAFVAGVLVLDGPTLYVYKMFPGLYRAWYWSAEFLTLILACGIILEIFRHVLLPYSGAERFARITGIFAFTVILFSSGVYPLLARNGSVSGTMEELERNVRSVQAVFLVALLTLISYYGIQIGKNMKGMIVGYGLSIAASLVSMAAYSYADGRFAAIARISQQLGYTLRDAIWVVTLWSYAPNPEDAPTRIEEDYGQLIERTRAAMGTMRAYLGKAVGP